MESLLRNIRLLEVQRRVQAAHCEAFLQDMERALDMARAEQSMEAEPSEHAGRKDCLSNISRPISPGLTPACCQSDGSIPRIYIPGRTSPYLPSANESPSKSPISECPHRSPNSTLIGCTPVYAAEAQARRRRHSLSSRPLSGRPAAMSPLQSASDSHNMKNVRCQRRSTDLSFMGCNTPLRASTEPTNVTADSSRRRSQL